MWESGRERNLLIDDHLIWPPIELSLKDVIYKILAQVCNFWLHASAFKIDIQVWPRSIKENHHISKNLFQLFNTFSVKMMCFILIWRYLASASNLLMLNIPLSEMSLSCGFLLTLIKPSLNWFWKTTYHKLNSLISLSQASQHSNRSHSYLLKNPASFSIAFWNMDITAEHNALMVLLTSYPWIVILAPFQFPYWISRNHIACLVTLAATFHSKILCIQMFIHC